MTMLSLNISIAGDFSPYPHGRFPKDGEHSGTAFREELLVPAVKQALAENKVVVIDIDGVKALGSSFTEEAFGGLVRMKLAPTDAVLGSVKVHYTKPWMRPIAEDIRRYMEEAAKL